jgi:hypothetical protein
MSGFSAPARVYSFNGKLSVAGEERRAKIINALKEY